MKKYRLVRERLTATGVVSPAALGVPSAASDRDLSRVHTHRYLSSVVAGTLDRTTVRRIGFPWSREMVERSRRSVGATIAACRAALDQGRGVNLAGGTHHAFADRGEGYCVFNDVAVAVRAMQAERLVRRVLIVDCDVHQGNGTAHVFRSDRHVCTVDLFGSNNFPFTKEPCDVAVSLPDGTRDDTYLDALAHALDRAFDRIAPELIVYVAGADPFEGDTLGRLALTKDGLAERDRIVLTAAERAGVPAAVVMGGGYGRDIRDTVEIHVRTVTTALGA